VDALLAPLALPASLSALWLAQVPLAVSEEGGEAADSGETVTSARDALEASREVR
jgi:hypothetical protein